MRISKELLPQGLVAIEPSPHLRPADEEALSAGKAIDDGRWFAAQRFHVRVVGNGHAAEIAGVTPPKGLDGISFLPAILGRAKQQKQHDYVYWEFYERGSKQAVRWGNWKAIRMPIGTGRIELYDLSQDLGEAHDIAHEHVAITQQAARMMDAAHTPHPNWQPRGQQGRQPAPGDGKARF